MIKTQKRKTCKPWVAFILSLVSTGLGQAYNGSMAKGMAFGLLRCLPFFLIPLAVLKEIQATYLYPFIVLTGVCIVITMISPCEALARSLRHREVPRKAYNSFLGYAVFFLVNTVVTALSIAVLLSFFSIERVADKHPGPIVSSGDYLLIKKFPSGGYSRGDMVFFGNSSVGRVIALGGDSVKYTDNVFFINGDALPLGYLADNAIKKFTPDWEDIVSESNDGKKYPVRIKASAGISVANLKSPVPVNHVLIARDQRLEEDFAQEISAGGIKGRVEGILYSSNLRKIMMDPWAGIR